MPGSKSTTSQGSSATGLCGRTVTAVLLVIILARVWGLDLRDVASQGVGAQLAGALVEVFLIGIVAYGFWELIENMANRQIAIERAALGLDDESEEQLEGEGGQGGTRLGTVKGTVEKISIRSMQLRHHNGPLNTVPFGEIRHLTKFSRDWVMMKLPLRVTYDTDVEKLRKLIKRLGQDLLKDPELGPMFLQPLKSQGVIQMEDSAMIIRVKFMTRPGDQWGVRNKVFARVRELFERENIKFAHREVTVRIADHEAGKPLGGALAMNAASPSASSVQASRYAAISSGVRRCSATS